MYFHTDDEYTAEKIGKNILHAGQDGKRVRIKIENGALSFKIGEGMWSAPIASTPDPYRD